MKKYLLVIMVLFTLNITNAAEQPKQINTQEMRVLPCLEDIVFIGDALLQLGFNLSTVDNYLYNRYGISYSGANMLLQM